MSHARSPVTVLQADVHKIAQTRSIAKALKDTKTLLPLVNLDEIAVHFATSVGRGLRHHQHLK